MTAGLERFPPYDVRNDKVTFEKKVCGKKEYLRWRLKYYFIKTMSV